MIEQLAIVQQVVDFLGLSESASIISDGLKMTEGAIGGQLLLLAWGYLRRFATPTKLEPVEKAIIDSLTNGNWDESKNSLVNGNVKAGFGANDSLIISVDGNSKATDILSYSAKLHIRKLIMKKKEEFKQFMTEVRAEEQKAEMKTILEKLSKKV
jgi:hypothetical protein